MRKHCVAVCKLVCVLAAVPAAILAQDASAVVANVVKTMGADNLKTIQFSGTGSSAGIGQNINPTAAWPVVRVKSYTREIDFSSMASHVQMVRAQSTGDQTQNQYMLPNSPWATQFDFWLNPFSFLKGAMANSATARVETVGGTKYSVVTFSLQNKYKVAGYINDRNMVEKVQTWIDNDVLGDMLAEASYSVYKDFGGVQFPTMIIEKQAGFPVLIVAVSSAKPNAAVNIQPPQTPAEGASRDMSVQSEKIADGVFYLKGGTHHSVAIEFGDHSVIIEAPQNEQRSLAVIAEVKRLIPNKPIRYLVNTHHHFDHSGGLRTYVAEGATIVTQEINKAFYEKAFAAPRTLNPDRLAQSRETGKIETVAEKKILSDGTRTLEIHLIKGSPHDDGILLAFLTQEKILIEADVYTPQAATTSPTAVNPGTANLVDNIERLKLDFEKILPLHGPGAVTRADLYAAIRKQAPSITEILSAQPPIAAGGRGGRGAALSPPDPKQILEKGCTSCHNLSRVTSQNLSKAEWQGVVDQMKGRGAEVSDAETSILIDYLVKTYGHN